MRFTTAVCALAAITASGASAQPVAAQQPLRAPDTLALTRARAVALALLHNPQLDVAREQTAQFQALKVQATAIPDPVATASLEDQPGFFRTSRVGERNIGADLTVPFPNKLRLQGKVAEADVRNSETAYTALRQLLAAPTAKPNDSLLVALRHRADLQEAKQLSEDFLKRTQSRFEAGTVPKLDVIKARVEVAQAENQLIANERDITNATAALNRFMGRALGAPVQPADTLGIPIALPSLAVAESLAVASRPELAGLAAERAGASAATSLAREFWIPDLTLGVVRDVTPGGLPAQFFTGLSFPVPVLFWQHTKGEIAQSEHRERELAAASRDLTAQIRQDVTNAYSAASTSLRQVLYIANELLPSAREAYRATSASYSLGGSSAFEVIDARRTLLDAESQYADALVAASTARADLQRAVGAPLDTIPTGAVHAQ
jgi:cobalt-zinc-cadmium efflux system outer membrane protein